MKEDTPVLEFIKMAWRYCAGNPHSWERFNQDVRKVCHIAAAGFPWESGDIDKIKEMGSWNSNVSRCLGESGYEGLYAEAVTNGNASAWTELERYMGRTPIIADGVRQHGPRNSTRKKGRLCMGSEFVWKGERVTVTSFNKDHHAVCCSYHLREDRCASAKIKHRYTLSADDIKRERKARKDWERAQKKAEEG